MERLHRLPIEKRVGGEAKEMEGDLRGMLHKIDALILQKIAILLKNQKSEVHLVAHADPKVRIPSFMSDPDLHIRGTILNKEDTGENFLRLSTFCSRGLRRCLLRKVKKLSSLSLPDLFDEVEITLQVSRNQGLPFVKEYQIIEKRMSIAKDRAIFDAAGFLARFYLANGEHLLESARFFEILQNALDSFTKHDHAPTILLKSLFLFSREEGLPVKESWFSGLSRDSAKIARDVLGKPVKDSVALSEQVPPLLESLCKWLRTETELRC